MFSCSVPFLLCTAIAVAGLSYFLYIPLYDGIGDRTTVRQVIIMSRLMKAASAAGEMVGWDSAVNMTKRISTRALSNYLPPQIDGVKSEDLIFDGTPVRLYRPDSAASPSPCVIFIHGGGWTLLNVDIYDEVVGELAVKSGYIFASIDYRLAPEYPYPIPFEDSYKASLHLIKHAEEYGIDEERIAIAGDSAGGNLAAAVALKLSDDEDIPPLRFQWLIYPALQAFTFMLPSYITNDEAMPFFLQTADMIHYWCNYMGLKQTKDIIETILADNHTSEKLKKSKFARYVHHEQLPSKYHDAVKTQTIHNTGDELFSKQIENIILDPYFAPLMKDDLSDVPPAFVVTAEYDVLRDDGLLYAERMKSDGVEVDVYNAPNSIHGYMFWSTSMPKYSNTDEVVDMFVNYAKRRM